MIDQQLLTDAFVLLLSGAAKWVNEREFEYFDGVKPITLEFQDYLPHTVIVRLYYPNRQCFREQHYLDGQLHGPELSYYSDGKLWTKREWCMGKPHGLYEDYSDQGIIVHKSHYDHGEQYGHQLDCFLDGTIWGDDEYVNGEQISRTQYTKIGELECINKYTYHPNGELQSRTVYKADGTVNYTNNYDNQGNIIKET